MTSKIICGDVQEVLRKQPADSFSAVLCDPPYGLGESRPPNSATPRKSSRERIRGGFMGMKWDAQVPGPEAWREVLRVVKPGGFLMAFGGTRTYHRLACAIEDGGWELRDCLMFLHGQGFPKSLDIGKAIDKQAGIWRGKASGVVSINGAMSGGNYARTPKGKPATDAAARTFDGYGTALKPAWEPIILAMKPLEGTFAENAQRHGVAGLNIDAGRISAPGGRPERVKLGGKSNSGIYGDGLNNSRAVADSNRGRWPANVLLDEIAAEELDRQSGILTSGNNPAKRSADKHRGVYAGWKGEQKSLVHRGTDSGGASRFFYVAKASKRDRGPGNNHPTVKPTKLTTELARYLLTLMLPPAQGVKRRLLVPFCGSGSEILGAKEAGWEYVLGIDSNEVYAAMARERIRTARQTLKVAA